MKTATKIAAVTMCAAVIAAVPAFAGCNSQPYVTSIAKSSSEGLQDTYTVYYSDGSTSQFTVTNGSDGVSADDLYEKYKEESGEDLTYEEFLEKYLTVENGNTASVINYSLQSCLKIYTEFVETTYSQGMWGQINVNSDTAVYTGSAVIYDIDTITDGYTYLVTNYHVVSDSNANNEKN